MLVGAVNMLMDISDHKRAEEYELLLVSIIESSDDAIVSKSLDGTIRSWNRGAERLFGYTAEEVIGKSIAILIPEDRATEEVAILQQLQNGQRVDHFETIRRRKDGTLLDISLTISPVRNAEGRIVGASKIARDISESKRAREQQKLLLGEMKHRVKNSLATVQAIALQTMHSASPEERAAFSARLHALGNAHDVLTRGWERANLSDIVDGALAPFQEQHRERFLVEGPDNVLVDATQSLLLAMALHELATNATKYGALSNRSGRVKLAWELCAKSPVPRLRLSWMERGGPPVTPPEHKGFGSRLIERALGGDRGDATFRFDPQGITCTLELLL
jgi:PAS domain S-box-containing protein